MELSEYGEFIETEIQKMTEYNPRIILDEWQVMPNHIHIIIELGEYNYNNGIANVDYDNVIENGNVPGCGNVEKIHEFSLPTNDETKHYRKQRRKMIIPKILGKSKMQTSKQINDARKTPGQKNWQYDYHDHVIRDEQSYLRIKTYIRNNPANCDDDKFHASCKY